MAGQGAPEEQCPRGHLFSGCSPEGFKVPGREGNGRQVLGLNRAQRVCSHGGSSSGLAAAAIARSFKWRAIVITNHPENGAWAISLV
jgi:NADPH:quinone reductase-like Zn-dependent oxidoreductase